MARQGWIGAAEAAVILDVNRCFLFGLIQSGEIPSAHLVDRTGQGRHYLMKHSEVVALRARGFRRRYRRHRRRTQFILWERYFGPVPAGYSPIFRDGDRRNIDPSNLCLAPLRLIWRLAAKGIPRRVKKRIRRNLWTPARDALLRAKFAHTKTDDLVTQLEVSKAAITRRARKLRLRKSPDYLSGLKRLGRYMPIGSERYHQSRDVIYVKVSDNGKPCERWRPKHHIIWEEANGRPLPTRNVVFKDGDRRNFDPTNLIAMSKEETTALMNIRQQIELPTALRKFKALTVQMRRKVDLELYGTAPPHPSSPRHHSHSIAQARRKSGRNLHRTEARRWTPEMDEALRREYPARPRSQIVELLGRSESSIRQRARRLKLQREPNTILAEARARADQRSPTLSSRHEGA